MFRLYDSVNGEWFSNQEFSEEGAKEYLLRNQDNESLINGDVYFADSEDYDGSVIELRDVVKDAA